VPQLTLDGGDERISCRDADLQVQAKAEAIAG
jgi:hypothetical protein